MKKLILYLVLLAPILSDAQQNVPPTTSGAESYSQMWSTSNAYTGQHSTYGTQKDTVNTGGSVSLTTSTFRKNVAKTADSVWASPLNGAGSIGFTCSGLLASKTSTVSPTAVFTLKESIDGIVFGTVSTATVTPTSRTTPAVARFSVPIKYSRYYQVQADVTGDTASVQASYYFLKPSMWNYEGN